jgi:hypothetical protein
MAPLDAHSTPLHAASLRDGMLAVARPDQTKKAYDPPKNTGFIPVGVAGLPICDVPFIAGP